MILRMLALLCLLLAAPGAVQARVVGIVFDDSGSMAPWINLPSFGAQLLISTLDGRPGRDRLFTVALNDEAIRPRAMPDRAAHQGVLDAIRTDWARAEGDTGYTNVQRMLAQVLASQQPGEEAFIVIVSDGQFSENDSPFTVADGVFTYPDGRVYDVKPELRTLLQQARGPVRIEYLLIAPGMDRRLIDNIRHEGIRPALLETFNGSPVDGAHDVGDFAGLLDALKDIIARVSNTDRSGTGTTVQVRGNRIEVDSPFSLSRILSVGISGDPGGPPRPVDTGFAGIAPYVLGTAMPAPDRRPGWERVLTGLTTHYRFLPHLGPGRHVLTYDRPVGQEVFLLFEADVTLRLTLRLPDGAEVPRGAGGRYALVEGAAYLLEAQVFGPVDGVERQIVLDRLDPGSVFSVAIGGADGSLTRIPLTLGPDARAATAPYTPVRSGDFSARATLTVPGFVSPASAPVALSVRNYAVTLGLDIDTEPPGNGAVATVIVRAQGLARDAALRLAMTGDESRYFIGDGQGYALDPDRGLALVAGSGARAYLWQRQGWSPDDPEDLRDQPVTVDARMIEPFFGEASVSAILPSNIVPLVFRARGHSRDASNETPLTLSGVDLLANMRPAPGEGLAFLFDLGGNRQEAQASSFTISGGPPRWLLDLRPAYVDGKPTITPSARWWCQCFLSLFYNGPHALRVVYDDGQLDRIEAQGMAPLVLRITPAERARSCLLILLSVIGGLYGLIAMVKGMRAQRFPRGSGLKVVEGTEAPRYLDLRSTNHTILRALVWPWSGTPHEVTRREGLTLRARSGGAILLLEQSDPATVPDSLGESIAAAREGTPGLRDIPVGWHEQFSRRGNRARTITMLRDIDER